MQIDEPRQQRRAGQVDDARAARRAEGRCGAGGYDAISLDENGPAVAPLLSSNTASGRKRMLLTAAGFPAGRSRTPAAWGRPCPRRGRGSNARTRPPRPAAGACRPASGHLWMRLSSRRLRRDRGREGARRDRRPSRIWTGLAPAFDANGAGRVQDAWRQTTARCTRSLRIRPSSTCCACCMGASRSRFKRSTFCAARNSARTAIDSFLVAAQRLHVRRLDGARRRVLRAGAAALFSWVAASAGAGLRRSRDPAGCRQPHVAEPEHARSVQRRTRNVSRRWRAPTVFERSQSWTSNAATF